MRAASAVGFLAVVIVVAGCGENGTVTTDPTGSEARPSLHAKGTARPLSGHCSDSYVVSNPVFLPPPDDEVLVSFEVDARGSCQVTHLGATTLTSHQVVRFDAALPQTSGRFVFRAANGDELYATEVGELSPDPEFFTYTGQLTFTGGTGRFAGATGSASVRGTGTSTNNTTEFGFEGSISY